MFKPNRKQTILGRAWACATIASLLCFSMVLAASGGLDTSFNGTGKLEMDIVAGQDSLANAIAIQPDGKIVAVGNTNPSDTDVDIAITRYTSTGALDKSFNKTGKKVTNLGGKHPVNGVVINKSTGKIIVAGRKCSSTGSACKILVLRYTPAGNLDTSFNGSGYRIDDYDGGESGSFGAVALQSDGKIVVGGYMINKTTKNIEFAIYRYTNTGTLDTSFNGTGKKAFSFSTNSNDYLNGIAIQPADGKIIVAGFTFVGGGSKANFALARLNSNGSLDTSFNGTGKQTTDFGGVQAGANSLALQSNGKIVLAGFKRTATNTTFALARYNTNGSLDTSFAGTGKKVFDFSGSGKYSDASYVNIEPTTGKIVVCGDSNNNFALARLTTTGTLDTTFNHTGKVSIDFHNDDECKGLAIQPADGKYVMAGWTYDHWALARVLP